MKITSIEPQKNNNDRVNIYLDGNFAFGISIEILYKYGLEKDTEIDEEYIKNVLKAEERSKAINYALNFLNFKWRTEKEIRNKMLLKGYDEEIIQETISYLKEQKLVDDRRFAEGFVKDKINFNKLGKYRLKNELYNKGISGDIIDEVLSENCDDELERAMELGRKKLPSYKNDDKNAIYRKLGGFLQRKGYSYDCISKVMKELLK
jgi:regulatory protein